MKKKFFAALLAAVMTAGMAGMSVLAQEDGGKVVIYENDFDASTVQEALAEYSNDYIYFGGYSKVEGSKPSLSNGSINQQKGRGPNGRTLLFDFTKGGELKGISSGILRISYDLALRGGELSDSYAQSYTGINMSNYWEGGRMVYFDATGWDTKNEINGWPGAPSRFIDSEVHNHEFIFNFQAQKAYYYIDGALQHTWQNLYSSFGIVKNYSIAMNGDIKSLDNMLIEHWSSMSPTVSEITESGAVLEYPENFAEGTDITGEMYYKNIYTGEIINAEATDVTDNSFVVAPEKPLVGGYEYELYLPEGIEGVWSGKSEAGMVEFNFGGMGTIKSFKTKDFDGNISKLQDENTALLEGFIIEFAEGMNAENYIGTLKIADDAQNEVLYTAECSDNVANITFANGLLGNKTYNVTIDNLAVAYNIIVKTGEGGIVVRPAKLYKEDGVTQITSLSEISAGEKIKAKFEVINAGEGSFSYLASVTMYNGKKMTGIDFENVVLESGMRKTTEAELTVSDVSDLTFNGFLWHPEKTMPVYAPLEFTFE